MAFYYFSWTHVHILSLMNSGSRICDHLMDVHCPRFLTLSRKYVSNWYVLLDVIYARRLHGSLFMCFMTDDCTSCSAWPIPKGILTVSRMFKLPTVYNTQKNFTNIFSSKRWFLNIMFDTYLSWSNFSSSW